jgi:hypothetical protein
MGLETKWVICYIIAPEPVQVTCSETGTHTKPRRLPVCVRYTSVLLRSLKDVVASYAPE